MRWLGVGVLLAGLSAVVYMIFAMIDAFPSPAVSGLVGSPVTATLESDGLTIFADDASFQMNCRVTDSTGREIPLKTDNGNTHVTINGRSWVVAAVSTEPTPPGTYVADCTSSDPGLAFAIGKRGSVGRFVGLIFGAIGTTIASIVIAIVLFVVPRRKKNRAQPPIQTYWSPPPPPGQSYTEY